MSVIIWNKRTLWALFVLAQITFLALAYFSFKQSQATNELLKKVILQNGLSQIHWNLNGLNQDDPILIQKIKNDILIPPNPHQTLTLKDPPETNESGQYGQVSRIEKILGLSKNNPKSGFFIEAGAADGEWFSNTLYFERHHGWTGLLVEPNPDLLSDLVKTHRNAWIFPHCLSTSKSVEVMKFDVSNWSSGIFLDPKIKPSRLDDPNRSNKNFEREILVQCFPLYSVLMALDNPHIDYCSLDIEGAEAAILKTVPWNQVNVTLFSVEINHAGKIFPESRVDIQEFMKKQGYKFHSTVVIDDIFYKKEINRF